MLDRILHGRLAHELVLPIWKSNVSVTLMLDKRAKRYVLPACTHAPSPLPALFFFDPPFLFPSSFPSSVCPPPGSRAHFGFIFSFISGHPHNSALSLRIFGEDITSAARDAAAKKKQKSEATPDAAVADAAVVDTPVLEDENADASGSPAATGAAEEE